MNTSTSTFQLNRRILVIDDNRAIHHDFQKILGAPDDEDAAFQDAEARIFGIQQPVSFQLDTASQGEEGLHMLEQSLVEGRPYAMAFVDVRMPPGWDGIETTQRLWRVCPDLQVVICTAFADCSWSDMRDQLDPLDRLLILKKPFDTVEVLQMANALTEKWRLLQESRTRVVDLEKMVGARTRDLEDSQAAALNMMEDAVLQRAKAEQAYEDLKREMMQRRMLEERFREQASLLDKAQEAIFVLDLDHRITYWNKGAERLCGWCAEEALGNPVAGLLYQDVVAFHAACERVMRAGEWVGELRKTSKSGRNLITEGHWTLVRDDAGQPKSILAINTDITEKKSMEAQFLRSQRMESVGRLSSGIAHDMNNILTPMLLSVAVLRSKIAPADSDKMLGIIETNAQRGADLIKQLLTFSNGAAGQREVVQVNQIVADLIRIMAGTFPKNISISSCTPDDVWPVMGDATQLHQVLLNLCVNARDAMAEGGRLSLTTENVWFEEPPAAMNAEAAPGPYVLLRVADTGEGIEPEVIDKIFDPFFTTKEVGKGTGLGLSTVIGIVKSHDGFVNLRSRVGSGSTFEIHLPAAPDAALVVAAAPSLRAPRGEGETILVVDDEDAIREIVKHTLLRQGYRVLTAKDGRQALTVYAEHRDEIKVVFTDLMMPLMDGVSMARALKEMNPELPIIAASGMGCAKTWKEKKAELQALNVATVLSKPYTPADMLAAIGGSIPRSGG